MIVQIGDNNVATNHPCTQCPQQPRAPKGFLKWLDMIIVTLFKLITPAR